MILVKGINKEIPISWPEVSFDQYIKLMKCGNDTTKVLSLFTGIDEATLKKAKIINLDQIIRHLSFVSLEGMNLIVPDKIAGYTLPKDLNFHSIAQFEDVKSIIQSFKPRKEGDPVDLDELAKFAEICAIYAYQGEYDYKEAEKLIPVFMNAPCEEVLAIGNFTLMKLISLNLNIEKPSLKPNTLMTKFKLALTAWRSNLAFTIRFGLWKRKLRTKGMSF